MKALDNRFYVKFMQLEIGLFQFLVSLRDCFLSQVETIMVSFRVPNFHDLMER